MTIVVGAVLLACGAVIYHRAITPPNCTDPRTLALVHHSLVDHFMLPDSARLAQITTVAGGYLAFRFVCEADVTGFDRHALPPGTIIPGTVHYISHLTDAGRRHEVNVQIAPLMILEQVQ